MSQKIRCFYLFDTRSLATDIKNIDSFQTSFYGASFDDLVIENSLMSNDFLQDLPFHMLNLLIMKGNMIELAHSKCGTSFYCQ